MVDWDKVVGENVRRLRMESALTQEKLGQLSDLTTRYVGMIERAETSVTVGVLGKLAAALGVHPGKLLGP